MAEADEVLAELVLGELEGGVVEICLDGQLEGRERSPVTGDRCLGSGELRPGMGAERVERVVQIGIEVWDVELRSVSPAAPPRIASASPSGSSRTSKTAAATLHIPVV